MAIQNCALVVLQSCTILPPIVLTFGNFIMKRNLNSNLNPIALAAAVSLAAIGGTTVAQAACNPCNPCAAKSVEECIADATDPCNPCNPCAAKAIE